MSGIERTMKKVGDKVVVSNILPDEELSSKGIIDNISNLANQLNGGAEQMQKIEDSKKALVDQIAMVQKNFDDLSKFKDWAWEIQESKARAVITRNSEECVKTVETNHKLDSSLTDEQNMLQKFRQYEHALATSELAQETLAKEAVQKFFFTESIVDNPWK